MNLKTLAVLPVVAAALAGAGAFADDAPPSAADIAALTAPVQKLVDAINQATPVPKGVFARDAVVLDDFAPYRWSGKTHARDWYKGLVPTTPKEHDAFVAQKGVVKINAAAYPQITGERAYVVFPSSYDYTDGGKRIHQTGQWLFIEEKVGDAWLIAGHSWAITGQGAAP
jgi:hypothetical protein